MNSAAPSSRLRAIAQQRKPVTSSTAAKADAAYQTASRVASECERAPRPALTLGALLEHVADAAHGVDQLVLEGIVDLGAEPAHVHVDDVGPGVEAHVPD